MQSHWNGINHCENFIKKIYGFSLKQTQTLFVVRKKNVCRIPEKNPTIFLPVWLGMNTSYSTGIYKIEINEKNQMLLRTSITLLQFLLGFCFLFTSLGCFNETSWLGHDEQSQDRELFKVQSGLLISLLIITKAKMTDVAFWQSQSFCCNLWLKSCLKLLSFSSLIFQAVLHIMTLLISVLVPNMCPMWSCHYPLLFISYSTDLMVSFATQHHLSHGCPLCDLSQSLCPLDKLLKRSFSYYF